VEQRTPNSTSDDIRLIRFADLCEVLGVSSWTLNRWIKSGKFLQPLYLTASSPAMFRIADVRAFLDKRRRARRTKPVLRGAALSPGFNDPTVRARAEKRRTHRDRGERSDA
jgi:predicted DNA-binding transcriptional regulator AlpA